MLIPRALSLARYNWPLYAICLFAIMVGTLLFVWAPLPWWVRVSGLTAAIIAAWYALASLVAFAVMFDRPKFLSGDWLADCVSDAPSTCVQVSVRVEEITMPLRTAFPSAECIELDLCDPDAITEPAINRARQNAGASIARPAKPESLPVSGEWSDFTLVTFAAHEIRDKAGRRRLFSELKRITARNGRVVIAEHLQNVPAALAFGPGLFHFFPRSEWLALASDSDLAVETEFDINPFIHIFVLRHKSCRAPRVA